MRGAAGVRRERRERERRRAQGRGGGRVGSRLLREAALRRAQLAQLVMPREHRVEQRVETAQHRHVVVEREHLRRGKEAAVGAQACLARPSHTVIARAA